MAVDKQTRRQLALLNWAHFARVRGKVVPDDVELGVIAEHPDSWQTMSPSNVACAWVETIAHVLHQVKFGVSPDSISQSIPIELSEPTVDLYVSIEPEPEPEPEIRPVDKLIALRASSIAAGIEGAESIKDATLHHLARRRDLTAEDAAKMLGAGVPRSLAAQFAALVSPGAEEALPPDPSTESVVNTPSVVDSGADTQAPVDRSRSDWTPVERPSTPATPPAARPDPPSPPDVRPSPQADRPVSESSGVGNLRHSDFVAYEYGSDAEVQPLSTTRTPSGQSYSWNAHPVPDGQVALYRLVSSDNGAPHNPESGELISVTLGNEFTDGRPETSAVRIVEVWCHLGRDVEHARTVQPLRVARGEIVGSVQSLVIVEDEGRVVGKWSVWPGTAAVRIFRVPLSGYAGNVNDPQYQILSGEHNLTGFVDKDVEPGKSYLYRTFAEVTVNGSIRRSPAVQLEMSMSVVLSPVVDLRVNISEVREDNCFDLVWSTPEIGRVIVYRTETPPSANLVDVMLAESALELQGMNELPYPAVSGEPGETRMLGIPWPADWDRAYLTPATALGGTVRMGKTVVQIKAIPPVTDARVIERSTRQIVTFGWPKSASSVFAYIGPRELSAEHAMQSAAHSEITAREYQRDGGLTFPDKLPALGCSLHLVPVAYSGAQQILGVPTSIDYPGLIQIWYSLDYEGQDAASAGLTISVASEAQLDSSPAFVLVHNVMRLPLSSRDGSAVTLHSRNDVHGSGSKQIPPLRISTAPTPTGYSAAITGLTGYVRLFLDLGHMPTVTFALIDPPIQRLWLDPSRGLG